MKLLKFQQRVLFKKLGQKMKYVMLLITTLIVLAEIDITYANDNTNGVNNLKVYTPTPMTTISDIFSVRVKTPEESSWHSVPVSFLYSVHYARLAGSGNLMFEITVADKIDNCTISPKQLGVKHEIDGNKVIFSISTQPRHLVLKINYLEYLCLLIDSLETNVPSPDQKSVVNVMDFVSDSDTADQTKNLQMAIDHMYTSEGKNILFFPSGIYKFRTLYFIDRIKPITIYISDGALLLKALRQSPNEEESTIWIVGSKNITVKGRGVIDCNGKANGEKWDIINQGCTMPFWIMDCENISVRDILIRNSSMWSMQVHYCKNFTLSNYKAINPPESNTHWTDGVNISLGDNVLVENCFAYCTDDIFATGQHQYETKKKVQPIYSYIAADTKNFVIRNLFGVTTCRCMIRFGCQSMGYSIKNYRFENCVFMRYDKNPTRGWGDITFFRLQASIKDRPGRIDGVYDNIAFVNCSWENDNNGANINYEGGEPTIGKLDLINCTFDFKGGATLSNIEELNVQGFKSGGKIRNTPEDAGFVLTNVKKVNWSGSPSQ